MSRLSEEEATYWNEALEKLSTYSGTVSDFCKEYSIDRRKLYYHRKKEKDLCSKRTVFHAISTTKDDNNISAPHKYPKDYTQIKIEIGKVRILIPSHDVKLLSSIIKELESSCLI